MARFALFAVFVEVLLAVRQEAQTTEGNLALSNLCGLSSGIVAVEASGKPKKFYVDFDGVSAAGKGTMLDSLKNDPDFEGLFTELELTFDRPERPGDDKSVIEFVEPTQFNKDDYAVVNAIPKGDGVGFKHYAIKKDAINEAQQPILISDIRPFRWPDHLTTTAQKAEEKDLELQSEGAKLTPLTFFVVAINGATEHKTFEQYLQYEHNEQFDKFKTISLNHTLDRLRGRGTETEEQIENRKKSNEDTLQNLYEVWKIDDLQKTFNIHFVVNDNKEAAWAEVKTILVKHMCPPP